MGAPSVRPCPIDGREPADVLVSGVERAPRTPSALRGVGPLVVLLATALAVTAAVVPAQRDRDARGLALSDAEPGLQLELRTGPVLVPRHRGSARPGGTAQARVHVEVVNEDTRTVRVLSAALTPGSWRAEVVDRDVVTPGESLVVALHRSVDCAALLPGRSPREPAPEQLVLTALLPDQTPVSVGLDVAREQPAYAGRLDDALRDPGRACAAPPGPRPTGARVTGTRPGRRSRCRGCARGAAAW